jgi:hypothetical protein
VKKRRRKRSPRLLLEDPGVQDRELRRDERAWRRFTALLTKRRKGRK